MPWLLDSFPLCPSKSRHLIRNIDCNFWGKRMIILGMVRLLGFKASRCLVSLFPLAKKLLINKKGGC